MEIVPKNSEFPKGLTTLGVLNKNIAFGSAACKDAANFYGDKDTREYLDLLAKNGLNEADKLILHTAETFEEVRTKGRELGDKRASHLILTRGDNSTVELEECGYNEYNMTEKDSNGQLTGGANLKINFPDYKKQDITKSPVRILRANISHEEENGRTVVNLDTTRDSKRYRKFLRGAGEILSGEYESGKVRSYRAYGDKIEYGHFIHAGLTPKQGMELMQSAHEKVSTALSVLNQDNEDYKTESKKEGKKLTLTAHPTLPIKDAFQIVKYDGERTVHIDDLKSNWRIDYIEPSTKSKEGEIFKNTNVLCTMPHPETGKSVRFSINDGKFLS